MNDLDLMRAYERAARRLACNAAETMGVTPLRRKILRAYFLVMILACLLTPLSNLGPALYALGGAVIGFLVMIAFVSGPAVLFSPHLIPTLRHLRTFPVSDRVLFWIQLRQGFTGISFLLKLIAAVGARAMLDFSEERSVVLHVMAIAVFSVPAVLLASVSLWSALSGLWVWNPRKASGVIALLIAGIISIMKFLPYLLHELLALSTASYRHPSLWLVHIVSLAGCYMLAEYFFIHAYMPHGSEIARRDSMIVTLGRRQQEGLPRKPWMLACMNEVRAILRSNQFVMGGLTISVLYALMGGVCGYGIHGAEGSAAGVIGGLATALLLMPLILIMNTVSGHLEGSGRPEHFISYLPVRRAEYTTGRALGTGLFTMLLLFSAGVLLCLLNLVIARIQPEVKLDLPVSLFIRCIVTIVPVSLGAGAFAVYCRESFPAAAEKMRVSLWGFAAAGSGTVSMALTFLCCGVISFFAPWSALCAWLFLVLFWSMIFTVFAHWGLSNAGAWRFRS